MQMHIKSAVVQYAPGPDRDENRRRMQRSLEQCASQGAQLVLLPELHNDRYFCQSQHAGHFDLAEPIPGPSTQWLSTMAAKHHMVIVGSLFEKRGDCGVFHNTAVVMDVDGGLAGIYRKMHIPDDPGYQEKYYFTPGDQGFRPVSTTLGKLGVLVCWDQWFPEAARLMALAGARLLCYPTAIGWEPADDQQEKDRQLQAWRIIQRSHGVANHLPVLVANRCGFEPAPQGSESKGIDFWGHSMIVGPQGEILGDLPIESGVCVAEVDLNRSVDLKRVWPFFRDRRIDHYGALLGHGNAVDD